MHLAQSEVYKTHRLHQSLHTTSDRVFCVNALNPTKFKCGWFIHDQHDFFTLILFSFAIINLRVSLMCAAGLRLILCMPLRGGIVKKLSACPVFSVRSVANGMGSCPVCFRLIAKKEEAILVYSSWHLILEVLTKFITFKTRLCLLCWV